MQAGLTREEALQLLMEYNQEPFHIRHGLTVEGVMRAFAGGLGFAEEKDFWGIVGLLHDIDYERYPEEHCVKAPEILRERGATEELIRAIVSHTYGIHTDIKPEHLMEKILFATDELTGLIGAAARMRPSKSTKDMELSSLKKKYKDKRFAAGCSREVIQNGADMLGWPLDDLLQKTILAMRVDEDKINEEMKALGLEG
jgi:putative nucleotidyltransferase with HDIG domain